MAKQKREIDLDNTIDRQIDKSKDENKEILNFVNDIADRLATRDGGFGMYGAFFEKMINDICVGKAGDRFLLSDFEMLAKFNISKKAKDKAINAFCTYFLSLCDYVECQAKKDTEKDLINDYENFMKAINLLMIAIPMNYGYTPEDIKKEIKRKQEFEEEGKEYYTFITEESEIGAYFSEFYKKAKSYFMKKDTVIHYLSGQERIQEEKDNFRDQLKYLDEFFTAKAVAVIRDGKLTQNVCDYVIENFAHFYQQNK